MNTLFEPGDDFPEVVDGLVSVTLRTHEQNQGVIISSAKRLSIQAGSASSVSGDNTCQETVWHLHHTDITFNPAVGHQIVDAEKNVWQITDIDILSGGRRYRCKCVLLNINERLDGIAVIRKAVWIKTSGGDVVPQWESVGAGIRGNVREIEGGTGGGLETQTTHELLVSDHVDIDNINNYRVLDGRCNSYFITEAVYDKHVPGSTWLGLRNEYNRRS